MRQLDPHAETLADALQSIHAYAIGCIADQRKPDIHWLSLTADAALTAYNVAIKESQSETA